MKKITLLVAVLALGLSFVSCNKEGQYSPKNKIDRIYYSSEDKEEALTDEPGSTYWTTVYDYITPKEIAEAWEWDGNLLKSISYYDGNTLDYTEKFEYDGKRLASVTSGTTRMTLNYDKKELASIDVYESTTRLGSYKFTHENGKIVLIKYYGNPDYKGTACQLPVSVLRFILPNADLRSLNKVMAHASTSVKTKNSRDFKLEGFDYELKLEWDGDNVSKVLYNENAVEAHATIQYIYDEKDNPFYGLFDFLKNEESYFVYGNPNLFSKNNVIRMVVQFLGASEIEEVNYSYTYNKTLPTIRTYSYSDTYNNGESRYSYTENIYYEYK